MIIELLSFRPSAALQRAFLKSIATESAIPSWFRRSIR